MAHSVHSSSIYLWQSPIIMHLFITTSQNFKGHKLENCLLMTSYKLQLFAVASSYLHWLWPLQDSCFHPFVDPPASGHLLGDRFHLQRQYSTWCLSCQLLGNVSPVFCIDIHWQLCWLWHGEVGFVCILGSWSLSVSLPAQYVVCSPKFMLLQRLLPLFAATFLFDLFRFLKQLSYH